MVISKRKTCFDSVSYRTSKLPNFVAVFEIQSRCLIALRNCQCARGLSNVVWFTLTCRRQRQYIERTSQKRGPHTYHYNKRSVSKSRRLVCACYILGTTSVLRLNRPVGRDSRSTCASTISGKRWLFLGGILNT